MPLILVGGGPVSAVIVEVHVYLKIKTFQHVQERKQF